MLVLFVFLMEGYGFQIFDTSKCDVDTEKIYRLNGAIRFFKITIY